MLKYIETELNLVPNYSFEKYSKCPSEYTFHPKSYFVDNWTMPTIGTPDYFNDCSVEAGIPVNWAGKVYPKTGKGYVGMISAMFGTDAYLSDLREYIQVKLKKKLEAGAYYYVGFHISWGQSSKYAIDKFGLYLSEREIDTTKFAGIIKVIPQIKNADGFILDIENKWHKIDGIVKSTGKEEYLIIGNFNYDEDLILYKNVGRGLKNYTYYFVDDVFVFKVDSFLSFEELEKNFSFSNKPYILEEVLFDFNEYTIHKEDELKLDALVKYLKSHQYIKIHINGHTDHIGSDAYNMILSEKRAEMVAAYLMRNGIYKSRISTKGFGKSLPAYAVNSNRDDLNRRVELFLFQ
ncbi:OmpA family protein [Bacteroidota bacterium]